ncbi:unnamed protein product [Scytosiphon promiscuus]
MPPRTATVGRNPTWISTNRRTSDTSEERLRVCGPDTAPFASFCPSTILPSPPFYPIHPSPGRRPGNHDVGSSDPQGDAEGEWYSSGQRRRSLWSLTDYDETVNPGADTFTLTAGGAAFESAIPSTLRVVSEGYVATRYDNIELTKAVGGDNLASFFEDVELADVLRGAVLSPVFAVDTYYAEAISTSSPLFKLPVDAVQRGRDHGLPTYNEARLVSRI